MSLSTLHFCLMFFMQEATEQAFNFSSIVDVELLSNKE